MHLTLYTDYTLRVLLYLGIHPERRVTITEISESYQISRNHLVKVVHQLSQRGLIETTRGKMGGMRLALDPVQINIGNVIRQSEPHMNLLECFDKKHNQCSITSACHLKKALYLARKAFFHVLDQYTLADVIGQNRADLVQILDSSHLENRNRPRTIRTD